VLVRLELPFVDARAADLALALGAPAQEAISALRFETSEHVAQLRLLGCSHQALISAESYELSELVACQSGCDGPLPPRASDTRDGHRYEFRARTRRLTPTAYAREADRLMGMVGAAEHGLVGTFAHPTGAFTALSFRAPNPAQEPATLGWETWHGYPQTHEIVFTSSEVAQ